MEKCGKIWKNGRFSGRLRPDWGNTTRAATAGLGSIGLNRYQGISLFEQDQVKVCDSEGVNLLFTES